MQIPSETTAAAALLERELVERGLEFKRVAPDHSPAIRFDLAEGMAISLFRIATWPCDCFNQPIIGNAYHYYNDDKEYRVLVEVFRPTELLCYDAKQSYCSTDAKHGIVRAADRAAAMLQRLCEEKNRGS